MKLKEAKAILSPVKRVQFQFAGGEEVHYIGIRLLSAKERGDAIAASKHSVRELYGIEDWDKDDPNCVFEIWVHTLAKALVDVPDDPETELTYPLEPFATAEDLRENPLIGQENLTYLYEQMELHEDMNALRPRNLSHDEVMKVCLEVAAGDQSPLDRMRPGTQRGFILFLVEALTSLATEKLHSTSDSDLSTE